MWAVPSTLPVSSLSFLSLSTINHSSHTLFSVLELLQSSAFILFFHCVYHYQWGSFHTADLLTVFYQSHRPSLLQPYISLTVYLIYLSYHLSLSLSHHFTFQKLSSTLCSKKNYAALLWVFFSWLEHPPPNWETSAFQRRSLGGPCRRCRQFSGFSSKPWAKKTPNTCHHSVLLSEMASVWNQRLFFLYLSERPLFEVKGFLKTVAVLNLLKMSQWILFCAGYTLHPALIVDFCAHMHTHIYRIHDF